MYVHSRGSEAGRPETSTLRWVCLRVHSRRHPDLCVHRRCSRVGEASPTRCLETVQFLVPVVLFSAPLHVSAALICSVMDVCGSIFSTSPSMGAVKIPVSSIVYSFIVASWLVYSWDRWLSGSRRRARLLILLTPLALTAAQIGHQLPMLAQPGLTSFMISGILLTYAVVTFYLISVYGVGKIIAGSVILWANIRIRTTKS